MPTHNNSTAPQPAQKRNNYNAPWCAVHLDHQGIITFANIAFEQFTQQPLATLRGQPLAAFLRAHDLAQPLLDCIFATRTDNCLFETSCFLICNQVSAHCDLFARYILDDESFVFMFTATVVESKTTLINECVQRFFADTLDQSYINDVFDSLQRHFSTAHIGVFCLLLQQPADIVPKNNQANVDFTGLWIFGKRIPTSSFASFAELIALLDSQSQITPQARQDPHQFGELPQSLNELLIKRFMSSGLRSYITITLRTANQLIGIIGLFSPFHEWITAISPTTLSTIQLALTQLYTRNQIQLQFNRLQHVNKEINTITNTSVDDKYFSHVCTAAQRIFDATAVLFAHYQAESNTYIITTTSEPNIQLTLDAIADTLALHTPQRHHYTQINLPPLIVHAVNYTNATALISVPILHNTALIGLLLVTHTNHELLTQQDIMLATQFADFAASHYTQHQLRNALNESERRYRFLVNESSNPIFVVGINDVVLHMNHAARRLIGVDGIDVLSFTALLAADYQLDWQKTRQLLASGVHHKWIWQSEITHQLQARQISIEIEAQVIKHESNTPEILISARDIRQQYEIERRQTLREQELTMLQHIISTLNSSLDLNVLLTRTLDIFDEIQFGQMLGIILIDESNEPYIATHRHVPPDLIAHIIATPAIIRGAVDLVVSNSDAQTTIYNTPQASIMASDLNQAFGNLIGASISDNGKYIGAILMSRPFAGTNPYTPHDIQILHTIAHLLAQAISNARLHQSLQIAATQFVNLYEETEKTRSHLASIIQNSPDILILCNRATLNIHILNKQPLSLLGHDSQHHQDHNIMALCHPNDYDQFALHVEHIKSQNTYSFEFSLLRSDKQSFVGLISSNVVNESEILVVIKDITPMRQLEQNIKQREKFVSIGQMIAGVIHELNNPIAIIQGITQLQLMQPHDGQLQKDLRTVEQTTQRAGRILNQLRSLVRPQASKHIAVDMLQLLQPIINQYRGIFAESAITCTTHSYPNESYVILGQSDQIEQMFVNIIDNAVNALRSVINNREIVVSFVATTQIITVFIDDTGIGIDQNSSSFIFNPFYTTCKIGEGLGLGLAIVNSIVQQHHGTIQFQSRPNGGTRFIIELPSFAIPQIRVAQQTIATEFYQFVCGKIREFTTNWLIEVESISDAHDLLILDEQLLASRQTISEHTVVCVFSRTTHTIPLDYPHRIIRVSTQMTEPQINQQMRVLVAMLNQTKQNKE